LEADGLVRHTAYLTIPPKVEYSLTEYDHSIHNALESRFAWGTARRAQKEKAKTD
jgi:DNA-binding HxlR family transcriptional regulator